MKKLSTAATFNVAFIFLLYIPTAMVCYLALSTRYMPINELSYIRLGILLLLAPIILKYLLQLFIAPWYSAVEYVRSRKRPADYHPSVSVLIPAWNEEVGIQATITSVLDTCYHDLEIIVINDGSTDRTHDVMARFLAAFRKNKAKHDALIKYKSMPNGGKARALNIALSLARGDMVVTIDADSVMDRSAIKNMVKHFSDPRVAAVAGNVIIGNRARPIGLIQQFEYLYGFYFKRADSILNALYIVGGAAAAYRREVIFNLGGFDESIITEDIELSTRLQDNGYHIRYAADAIVYTEGPSDLDGLYRQRLRWKFGRLLTFYKYRHLFFSINRKHNFYLCFLILPLALFAEFLLFFEGLLLMAFYAYTFYTNDFMPLVFVISLLTGVVCLQIFSDPKARYHRNLLFLAPNAWILFYFMDFVEYRALIKSVRTLMTKQDLGWQKWVRVGVFSR
ncbi:MAG: glycosyltransferase [Candidatus Sungbacteria bacterium]|nr:glycosyltransferase [Candidatus Sungbacteria bacterium]